MKLNSFNLTKTNASILETDILFAIASTRAREIELLELNISDEGFTKIYESSVKILKKLKKQGKIQIYISSEEFFGTSKEAMYLKNKYPELDEVCEGKAQKILIKI